MRYIIIAIIAALFGKAVWDKLPDFNITVGTDIGFTLLFVILFFGGIITLFLSRWIPPTVQTYARWAATAGIAIGALLFIFGEDLLEAQRQQLREIAAPGTGNKGDKPLTAEQQAARLTRERQEAALAAERRAAEAKAQAEADAARRLAEAVTRDLPAHIAVPHCDRGMSQPVMLPVGWHLRSGWGGGVLRIEYLSSGQWKVAQVRNIQEPVEAFRYCTTSPHNAALGRMPLEWKRL